MAQAKAAESDFEIGTLKETFSALTPQCREVIAAGFSELTHANIPDLLHHPTERALAVAFANLEWLTKATESQLTDGQKGLIAEFVEKMDQMAISADDEMDFLQS
jgi:hypothetical protein